jgi:hypothetical protein
VIGPHWGPQDDKPSGPAPPRGVQGTAGNRTVPAGFLPAQLGLLTLSLTALGAGAGKEDWTENGSPAGHTEAPSPPSLPLCQSGRGASPQRCWPGRAALHAPAAGRLPRCGCAPDADLDLVGCLLVWLFLFCCCCLDLNIFFFCLFCFLFCDFFFVFFCFVLFLPFMVREGNGGRFHYNRNRKAGFAVSQVQLQAQGTM